MIELKIKAKRDDNNDIWLKKQDVLFAIIALGAVIDGIKKDMPDSFKEMKPSDIAQLIKKAIAEHQ